MKLETPEDSAQLRAEVQRLRRVRQAGFAERTFLRWAGWAAVAHDRLVLSLRGRLLADAVVRRLLD